MKCNLESICDYRQGRVKVTELNHRNYISTENMLPNKSGITTASSLPSIESTQKFKQGDILVSNIRPYFKKIWKAKFDGGCSNDVLVFTAKEGIDQDFLYYVLSDDRFFGYVMATSKGTKMPRGDKKTIMKYQVPLFKVEKQEKIASILCKIDARIELNKEINNNLEQQANAIFIKEFLRFENLPKGWKKASLIDIADYLNGLAMQKYRPKPTEPGIPVLKIRELRQGFCDKHSDLCSQKIKKEYIVQDDDVIFSWSGSLLVDFWCGGTCGLNQHLFKVTSNKYDKWFYYVWTKYHLDRFITVAADRATTMGHIKRDELSKAEVLIPDRESYLRIGNLLQNIYDSILLNRKEAKLLSELRDALIPKLLNGEVEISNIDF